MTAFATPLSSESGVFSRGVDEVFSLRAVGIADERVHVLFAVRPERRLQRRAAETASALMLHNAGRNA